MGTAVSWLGFEPVRPTGRPTTHPDALRARIDSCRPFPSAGGSSPRPAAPRSGFQALLGRYQGWLALDHPKGKFGASRTRSISTAT